MTFRSSNAPGTQPIRAIRAIVISDLHLGGTPAMMGRPKLLEAFIDGLHTAVEQDEQLELVIAGDFIDFLSIEPYAAFTPDPIEAVRKLDSVMANESTFSCVFDALKRHIEHGHKLVILVGNHDVEIALPDVQKALQYRIAAGNDSLHFVDDGRAYRIGNALVEHGNAHDGANANDWDGLRHLISSQSRGYSPEREVRASVGSQIVHEIVNILKNRYPFLPTLQPEGELLALLLFAFEPSLKHDITKIREMFKIRDGEKRSKAPPEIGEAPMSASGEGVQYETEFRLAFAEEFALLDSTDDYISVSSWIKKWRNEEPESLSHILGNGRAISPKKLEKLRLGISRIVNADDSESPSGPTHQYGVAAEKMLAAIPNLQVVVMGHTHVPRKLECQHGIYINAGTWIDRFRIPAKALDDKTGNEFLNFLKQLLNPAGWPVMHPTYADLSIEVNGNVRHADLCTFTGPLP